MSMLLSDIRDDNPSVIFFWKGKTKIGSGSYAVVYQAECVSATTRRKNHKGFVGVSVGEAYAIKVIHKKDLSTEKHWRCLAHEIGILKCLQSPHCVRLYDCFQDEEDVYLVMELVNGGELFDVIVARGQMTEKDAIDITVQLVRTLVYLHQLKIVHRDLKPENILLEEVGLRVKIIDFGFAKFIGNPAESMYPEEPDSLGKLSLGNLSPDASIPMSASDLVASTPLGTVGYLAPEIIKALLIRGVHPRVTTRADLQKQDIFSLGVIVYAMLGGELPFPTELKQGILERIYRGLSFPKQYFGHVSQEAIDFVTWLLQADRKRRPLASELMQHPWLCKTHISNASNQSSQAAVYTVSTPVLQREFYDEIRKAETALDKEADQEFIKSMCFAETGSSTPSSMNRRYENCSSAPMATTVLNLLVESFSKCQPPMDLCLPPEVAKKYNANVVNGESD